jgi:hypothetical protein
VVKLEALPKVNAEKGDKMQNQKEINEQCELAFSDLLLEVLQYSDEDFFKLKELDKKLDKLPIDVLLKGYHF